MKTRYYISYPRDFANEYNIFVVGGKDNLAKRVEKALIDLGAERITKKRALYWGITRPAEAKKTGEQWYGGFVGGQAFNNLYYTADEELVEEALISDTIDSVGERQLI